MPQHSNKQIILPEPYASQFVRLKMNHPCCRLTMPFCDALFAGVIAGIIVAAILFAILCLLLLTCAISFVRRLVCVFFFVATRRV
jgi:hypothetical protein